MLDEIASCDHHTSSMGIECAEETSSRRSSNTSITTVSVQIDTEETTAPQSDEGVVTDQLQSVVPSVDDGELSYQP